MVIGAQGVVVETKSQDEPYIDAQRDELKNIDMNGGSGVTGGRLQPHDHGEAQGP